MRESTNQTDRIILAIKRCIESNSEFNWDDLAYLTGGKDIIYKHPRLLTSFRFEDDDYGSSIFRVIEQLMELDPGNLQIIIDYINLPEWLKENYPQDFENLYGQTQPLLDAAEQIAIANSFELNQHIDRIRKAVGSDPGLAVGSTKELLESVLKTVLKGFGEEVGKKDDIPELLKRAQKVLKLDPNEVDFNKNGRDTIKRTLSNLGQIVSGINELRGIYGTGHGDVHKAAITPRHARLVVNAGATLAAFLMETFEWHKQNKIPAE